MPEDAPFAYERVVAAVGFLVDADRYAEGNNPEHGHQLLASAASVTAKAVTAHRTHQPHPWPARWPPDRKARHGFHRIAHPRPHPATADRPGPAGRHAQDTPGWAAALVDATAAPVLIAVVDDSDTALLLADSPGSHRWVTVLNAPADTRAGRRSPTPGP